MDNQRRGFERRFNRWELLVVVLGLVWALIEAYLDPRRFDDLILHLFVFSMIATGCAVVWLLVRIIIGVVRHRKREGRA